MTTAYSEVKSRCELAIGLDLPDGLVIDSQPIGDGYWRSVVAVVIDEDRRYLEAKRRMADHLTNREA